MSKRSLDLQTRQEIRRRNKADKARAEQRRTSKNMAKTQVLENKRDIADMQPNTKQGRRRSRSLRANRFGGSISARGVADTVRKNVPTIMPTWADDRDTPIMTAWDGEAHIIHRHAGVECYTNLAAYRTAYAGAFYAAYSPENMKDWVDAQRQAFEELVFLGAQLLVETSMQAIKRAVHGLITESDAGTYWTQNSWDEFLAGIENKGLMVPLASVNIAKAICVGWIRSPPDAKANLPAAIYFHFMNQLTLANAITLRGYINDRVALARLHAAKVNLPMVALTINLMTNECFRWISFYGNEMARYWMRNIFHTRNATPTDLICGLPANMDTNTTTGWTNQYFMWKGETLPDVWATCPMIDSIFNGTNNPFSFLTMPALGTNQRIGFYYAAQDDTAFTLCTYSFGAYLADMTVMIPTYSVYTYNTSVTWTINPNSLVPVMGEGAHCKTGISRDSQIDWLLQWFAQALAKNMDFEVQKPDFASLSLKVLVK